LKLGRHLFSREENRRLDHEAWSLALAAALRRVHKNMRTAKASAKGADWKLRIVVQLRATTSVTVPWLAQALHIGTPGGVRALLARHNT